VRILFLTGRFPYPLLRGDQLRAFHQLRVLGRRHRVTLVSFTEGEPSPDARAAVAACCERVVTVPLSRVAMAGNLARRALSRLPFQAALYDDGAMRRALGALAGQGAYDVAHVQLARMAPHLAACPARARVVDLVDALSLGMTRRAARERPPARWAAIWEARRLRRYEARVVAEADGTVVTSPADRDALGPPERVAVVPNGVDTERFPAGTGPRVPGRVVFTGNLGYFANADAVLWFAAQVLPALRRSAPGVRFEVAGARPPGPLRRLARAGDIDLLGPVADVGERLRSAQVAVAPLQAGSGQSNKTLEALASATPAVITPLAAAGLVEVRDGEHVLVAASAEDFAAAVARIMDDPALGERLGAAGRRLVETSYTWERSVDRLEQSYARALEGK